MKTIILAATLIVAHMSTPVSANTTRCSEDWQGNTVCRDSNGNQWKGSVDWRGDTVWKDNNGNRTTCSVDWRGDTVCRSN